MIYDKITNLEFYAPFDKRFLTVSKWMKETDIDALEDGSYELGEGILANVSEYEPLKEEISYEGHKKYADLQYLHRGDELIEWAPIDEIEDLSDYVEEYDFHGTMKSGKTHLTLTVDEGSFAYFAPCDLHRPGLWRNADKVKKVVFKLPVID